MGEGRAFYNLGIVYLNQEKWVLAREHLESSLKFIRDVDIRHSHDIDEYKLRREVYAGSLASYL